jgi:LDH2 family malate/lactate/ureidoglycolate dehydrogenase
MRVPISKLRQKIESLLTERLTEKQAERIIEVLLWADMSGIKTQGVTKLLGTELLRPIKPGNEITAEFETSVSQRIDGGGYPAMLVSQQATDIVIDKAKRHDFGIVGVRNTFSSNGALAFYAQRIAESDLVGLVMARSPAGVAPFGGTSPLFGTNPLSFSFPAPR